MTHQGERIDQVRETIGMTKAELARRIGTSNQNLHGLLGRGKIRSIEQLKSIGEVLNHDFIGEFYEVEESESSIQEVQDELKLKYKMQGQIDQLERMVKKEFAKEIGSEISKILSLQISTLSNQMDSIIQRQKDLDKMFKSYLEAQKTI